EDDSIGERRYIYVNADWGASLGEWGNLFTWSKWDCKGFARQTPKFVKGLQDGQLEWGFKGKHRKDITTNISVQDVEWILKYFGKITDEQIRSGLAASGATQEQIDCYTRTLRERIEQLEAATAGTAASARIR